MNIYDALKEDHLKIKALLAELIELRDGERARAEALVANLRNELLPHARAEEAVFYNSIRAVSNMQNLIWQSYGEHMEAEALLGALEVIEAVNLDWRKTAQKLKDTLGYHIGEEEENIFPVARQLFTEDEAEAMTQAFIEMKAEVREGSFVQATLDLIANLLPTRLAVPLRTFTLHENP